MQMEEWPDSEEILKMLLPEENFYKKLLQDNKFLTSFMMNTMQGIQQTKQSLLCLIEK